MTTKEKPVLCTYTVDRMGIKMGALSGEMGQIFHQMLHTLFEKHAEKYHKNVRI